jgi:hypothetical protein
LDYTSRDDAWSSAIPLAKIGDGGRCGTSELKPDEHVTYMNVKWDIDHGVTEITVFYNTDYFFSVGKHIDEYYEHNY